MVNCLAIGLDYNGISNRWYNALVKKRYYRYLLSLIGKLIPPGMTRTVLWSMEDLNSWLLKPVQNEFLVMVNLIGDLQDIQKILAQIVNKTGARSRIIIIYYNHLWEPVIKLASALGLRKKTKEQNWLDDGDINNLLKLSGWDPITTIRSSYFPLWHLFTIVVARPKRGSVRNYSTSIIIPARNEAGNIARIIREVPRFGRPQEIIFIEGHSRDQTWETIKYEAGKKNLRIPVRYYKQTGIGKADAVRLGFKKARGKMLLILDADLTVDPKELPKFYRVIASRQGEFVNGCRLVYPMEKEAMRWLNKIGNKFFGWAFSRILGQKFKDTLCGTKALLASDYQKVKRLRKEWGNFDPFGDFDLIFGAAKYQLKVVELPVRYKERKYGRTNISRIKHGWLLFKMVYFAMRNFIF